MKTISFAPQRPDAVAQQIADVVSDGGLVCFPCGGTYRIAADLTNVDAVMALMESKGRARKAPALIFIDAEARLDEVAVELDPAARSLAHTFWPSPLTIRVQLNPELPRKVVKQLGGSKAKAGVRVPAEELARRVVSLVGRPLLVSSANRERKNGESSPAQVRKTFGSRVDLFVDQGDLPTVPASTVVDVVKGKLEIEREGAIDRATLEAEFAGSEP